MSTVSDKRLAFQKKYPNGDCLEWNYNFYVINRSKKFLFGFDERNEAEAYVKELRKDSATVKIVTKDEAMKFVYPPQFEHSWTDSYKHISGLTED